MRDTLDYTNMDADEFELVVKYLYSGQVAMGSVSELCFGLYVAELWELAQLETECQTRLRDAVRQDAGAAVKVLELDERFVAREHNSELFAEVDAVIQESYSAVLGSTALLDVNADSMRRVLDMDTADDVSEMEVFRALLAWSRARCTEKGVEPTGEELRAAAGDLIYLVRWSDINVDVFCKEVVPTGLLDGELVSLVVQKQHGVEVEVPFATASRKVTVRK